MNSTHPCTECGVDVVCDVEFEDAAVEVICPGCRLARDEFDLARRRARIGVPPGLEGFTFASIDNTTGIERAIGLANRWGRDHNSLHFDGRVGTGKTRVAVAAANELVRYRPVRFFSAPILVARLGTGEFSSPERRDATNVLLGRVALVLDDLDKTRATAYAAEVVFMAIDARVEGSAPLLVTTNLTLGELAEYWPQPWGEAIASRLLLATGVTFGGPDRRAA